MSFLAPLFLLGGLAVALPVVFHLIRQTTRERTVFSSLMFLRTTPPRLTRRNRLEHLLLLALRCAILVLLAVGFARPFLKTSVEESRLAGPARRVLVLVDTGASMRRGGLWAEAGKRLRAVMGSLSPADQAALFTFDRDLLPWMSFEQWKAAGVGERAALLDRVLAGHAPGWHSGHLDQALIRAAELVADNGEGATSGHRQIILISDLKEGNRLSGLQSFEWPKGIEVLVQPVGAAAGANAGLELLADASETEATAPAGIRVRVNNTANSRREQFQVAWAGADGTALPGQPVDIYVPAGQSRVISLPLPAKTTEPRQVVLRGDDESFDNRLFLVPLEPVRADVLYLGSEAARDSRQPFYFLQRAFQDTRRRTVRLTLRPASSATLAADLPAAGLIFVTEPLPGTMAAAVREQAENGKTVVCVLRSEAMASTLAALTGTERVVAREAATGDYAMLAGIDFQHPLFAPFADPRFNDFTKIHFWKHREVQFDGVAGARVLARWDGGDPAVAEVSRGKGRVVVLTSGWDPADSQLALSSKFVPLLQSLLELNGGPEASANRYVGDSIPLVWDQATADVTVRCPDGTEVKLAAGTTRFDRTTVPGIYQTTGALKPRTFAVNLDPAESRTAPLSGDALERLGVPVSSPAGPAVTTATAKTRLQNAELESRQGWWRWVLLASVALLVGETWLAGRTARRAGLPEGALP